MTLLISFLFFCISFPPKIHVNIFNQKHKKKRNSILIPACPSLPPQTPLDDFKKFLEQLFSTSLEHFLPSCILSFACSWNLRQITSSYSNLGPYCPLCGHPDTFHALVGLFPETFALLVSFVSSAGGHLPPLIIHVLSWELSLHHVPGSNKQ